MPDGRRVYLHIGEPKTGTSFLQDALWGNRVRLAAQGILLPGYSNGGHARASQDLREAKRLPSDPTDPWVGEWDVLAGQALRVRRTAVISNELLAACGPGQADRAVQSLLPSEVHVIATVRDFASLLPAEWQETVKCRATAGWDEWLGSVIDATQAPDRRRRSWFWRVHDTLAILAMWTRHIPPDQVHVITVPPDGRPEELWLRFASVLGVDSSGIDLPAGRANSSLGVVEAEFLRRLNEALPEQMPNWFYTWNVKRILAHDVLTGRPRGERLVLPPDRVSWAREQAGIVLAGLRDSKYHIIGDLDELIPQRPAGRYVAPADVPAEQLLDAAVQAAAALADHQYRRDIITSSGELAASLDPARQQRAPGGADGPGGGPGGADAPGGSPGRVRRMAGRARRAALTTIRGSRLKRMLYGASGRPIVRRLRIAAWCVLRRPGR